MYRCTALFSILVNGKAFNLLPWCVSQRLIHISTATRVTRICTTPSTVQLRLGTISTWTDQLPLHRSPTLNHARWRPLIVTVRKRRRDGRTVPPFRVAWPYRGRSRLYPPSLGLGPLSHGLPFDLDCSSSILKLPSATDLSRSQSL